MDLKELYVIPDCFGGISDSAAIQRAVDDAARLAPGENLEFKRQDSSAWRLDATVDLPQRLAVHPVLIPAKADGSPWVLDTTILLHDFSTVILDGCVVECADAAFKNERADDPRAKSLRGEQPGIKLIGRSGAVLRGTGDAPQIRLSNVKEFHVRGLTFEGGGGLSLDFARVGKVQRLRFEGSRRGLAMSAGCSGLIIEDIDARTGEEAVYARGTENVLYGRDPDVRKSIVRRVKAKTGGAPAVALYGGKNPLCWFIVRDVTDLTRGAGASVVIGAAEDEQEIIDISVTGVDSRRTAVATGAAVDGLYLGSLKGKKLLDAASENTRVYLDEAQLDIEAPREPDGATVTGAVSANDPKYFGLTDDRTIQKAVDAAAAGGIGRVVVPRFNARTGKMYWDIKKAIVLPSGVTVELCAAHLRQHDFTYENIFTNAPGAKNVAVVGVGDAVLDGGRHNGLKENNAGKFGFGEIQRNAALRFEGVDGLTLEGFQINQSRWYGIFCAGCSNGRIADIDFMTHAYFPDLGGVMLAPGCHDLVIEDLTGKVGENGVCLCATHRFGQPDRGKSDIHHITVSDLKLNTCRSFTVNMLCHDGCKLHDVTVDGIMDVSLAEQKMVNAAGLVVGSGEGWCDRPGKPGELSGVTVRGVCTRGNTALEIGGCVDKTGIHDIHSFSGANSSVTVKGGARLRDVRLDGLFFRCQQGSLYMRGTATSVITDKKKYRGLVLSVDMASGRNVVIENVLADRIGEGVKLSGGGALTVKDFTCAECGRTLAGCAAGSSLTFNGKKVN